MSASATTFRGFTKGQVLKALRPVASNGVANSASAHLLDVGTDAYLDLLEKEFLQVDNRVVGSTVRVFEGPSGSGKTHLLNLLSRRATAANYVTVRTNLSDALHLEDWKFIARHILEAMEAPVGQASVRSFPAILSAVGQEGRVELIEHLKECKAPHPGFKNASAWAATISPDHVWAELLFGFLRGERVSASTLADRGFHHIKDPLSERNAERVLRTVAQVVSILGFKGLVILFDENENSLVVHRSVPSKRVYLAANLIRRLIDACASNDMQNTLVVFTVLPQFLDNAKRALPALGLRTEFFRNIQTLTKTTSQHVLQPGWRFPIQEVDRAAYPLELNKWRQGVIDRYCELLDFFDIPSAQHRGQLTSILSSAARTDAGAGVRRKIQKGLSEHVLNLASRAYWLDEEDNDF